MISTVLMPDYYADFSCTGSACAHTCCQNWGIDLSRADYNKIRSAKKGKELEELLKQGMKRHKQSVDETYAYITTTEQACVLLRNDGLCRLQVECGGQVLPLTCRLFPRITAMGIHRAIRACTAGCTEIMKALMLRNTPLSFVETEEKLPARLHQNFTLKKDAHPLVHYEVQVLEVCVDLLQNRAIALQERIVLLGMALRALHELEQTKPAREAAGQEARFAAWHRQYAALAAQRESTLDTQQPDAAIAAALWLLDRTGMGGKEQEGFAREIAQRTAVGLCVTKNEQESTQTCKRVTVSYETYAQQRQALYAGCAVDIMLENIMVNYLFSTGMPFSDKSIWLDYVFFCQLYNLLHFVAVGTYAQHQDINQLICDWTVCYRNMAHNVGLKKLTLDHAEAEKADTLAHMAVLLRGA